MPLQKSDGTNRNHFLSLIALLLLFFTSAPAQGAGSKTITLAANSSGAQIQNALDQLPDGGTVDLAAGTYEIHQPIILRRNGQTLRGQGTNTILFLATQANCPVIILGTPTDKARQTTSHLRLADMLIDGNRKNQQVELWRCAVDGSQLNNNGVDVWNVDDATVERVVCCRCRSGGLVTAVTRHLTLADFTAYDNQFDGLACYLTEDSHFSGLRLHDNLCAGISLDLAFNHNVISDSVLTGNDLGIFMRYSRDNVFNHLVISKSRHDGVFMAQTSGPTATGWGLSPGTECAGNTFDGLEISACGRNAFLVNDTSCINNAIRGARFVDNSKGGLVEGDGKVCNVSLAMAETVVPETKKIVSAMQAVIVPQGVAGPVAGH